MSPKNRTVADAGWILVETRRVLVVSGTRGAFAPLAAQRIYNHVTTHMGLDPKVDFGSLQIITGDAKGVDAGAIAFCEFYSVGCISGRCAWKPGPDRKLNRRAGRDRNEVMFWHAYNAQQLGHRVELLALPGDDSKGTYHALELARFLNIPWTIDETFLSSPDKLREEWRAA